MAKINHKEIPEETIDQVIEKCKLDEKSKSMGKHLSIFNIFTKKHLLKNSLIVFFLWFVNSGTYYGLSLGASNLGGNQELKNELNGLKFNEMAVRLQFSDKF